jgi:RNA ligase
MIEVLNKYYDEGLLYKQTHPSLPLIIWNYTEKVQFENLWDNITLMTRGLVTDFDGNIVARPFEKFFNMEENKYIPTPEFEVYEKMDGSLGVAFYYNDKWIIATRGSFVSDQAIEAMELIKKYPVENLNKKNTYLFEIIY